MTSVDLPCQWQLQVQAGGSAAGGLLTKNSLATHPLQKASAAQQAVCSIPLEHLDTRRHGSVAVVAVQAL